MDINLPTKQIVELGVFLLSSRRRRRLRGVHHARAVLILLTSRDSQFLRACSLAALQPLAVALAGFAGADGARGIVQEKIVLVEAVVCHVAAHGLRRGDGSEGVLVVGTGRGKRISKKNGARPGAMSWSGR